MAPHTRSYDNAKATVWDILGDYYRPQTKFAKVMFLQVSVCPPEGRVWLLRGGTCVVAPGGCVHGCSRGGIGGCSWGGHVWLLWGVCMVAPGGGVHGCSGGACIVALGGHAWFLWGEVCGCTGGACIVALGGHAWFLWGGVHGSFDEIRSMSGRYTSYWNAFLFNTYYSTRNVQGLHDSM